MSCISICVVARKIDKKYRDWQYIFMLISGDIFESVVSRHYTEILYYSFCRIGAFVYYFCLLCVLQQVSRSWAFGLDRVCGHLLCVLGYRHLHEKRWVKDTSFVSTVVVTKSPNSQFGSVYMNSVIYEDLKWMVIIIIKKALPTNHAIRETKIYLASFFYGVISIDFFEPLIYISL